MSPGSVNVPLYRSCFFVSVGLVIAALLLASQCVRLAHRQSMDVRVSLSKWSVVSMIRGTATYTLFFFQLGLEQEVIVLYDSEDEEPASLVKSPLKVLPGADFR